MNEQQIKELISEKAKVLDLKYEDIVIEELEEKYHGFHEIGNSIHVDMSEGIINLMTNNISIFSDEQVERIIEHEVCHCKDWQEEVYGHEVMVLEQDSIKGVSLEMYAAYTDYFASQRQISTFGIENFDKFQENGLDEFVKRTNTHIYIIPLCQQQLFSVAAFYKEQLKCELMKNNPEIIPPIIKVITNPFKNAFEEINKKNMKWIDKTPLLFLVSLYSIFNIDVVKTYIEKKLATEQRPDDLVQVLIDKNMCPPTLSNELRVINELLDNGYKLK